MAILLFVFIVFFLPTVAILGVKSVKSIAEKNNDRILSEEQWLEAGFRSSYAKYPYFFIL